MGRGSGTEKRKRERRRAKREKKGGIGEREQGRVKERGRENER